MKTLYPYQQEYVNDLLANPIRGLPLQMGKGKTAIQLEVLHQEKLLNKLDHHVALVIAPKNIIYNVWQQEAEDFGHTFTFHILHGKGWENIPDVDIYLMNPEGLLKKEFKVPICHALIFDESTLFKNHTSKRFKRVKKILKYYKRRSIMTGTPAPNNMLNIWSQIYLLDQGKRLETAFTRFRNIYFYPHPNGFTWTLKDNSQNEILSKIKDIFYHREVLNDRAIIFNKIKVQLTPKAVNLYKEFKRSSILKIFEVEAVNKAVLRHKLKQLASGFIYDDQGNCHYIHSEKINMLKYIIESQQGHPLLVFYNFKAERDLILSKLSFTLPCIDGETDDEERQLLLSNWNKKNISILLASAQCIAHGLNMQEGGHTICWYSLTDDLEVYQQANGRLNRTGQTEEVIVHHLLCEDTVDDIIYNALEMKCNVQEYVLQYLRKEN